MALDTGWLALSLLPSIGIKTLRALIAAFGSSSGVLAADQAALMEVKGVGQKIAAAIMALNLAQIEAEIADWQQAGLKIVPHNTPDYPQILATIPDPPATLFMRGEFDQQLWKQSAAIVGTRNPTPIAQALAKDLSNVLSAMNYTIVSGLALGIDTIAHRGALTNSDGRTIAVLGGGVLQIYPAQNQSLAERIMERGLLLGENHPDGSPTANRLVRRNRIISGLCEHLFVIETTQTGGAMYAARAALEQRRKLYTFDLPVSGNQHLIEHGAHCIKMDFTDLPL